MITFCEMANRIANSKIEIFPYFSKNIAMCTWTLQSAKVIRCNILSHILLSWCLLSVVRWILYAMLAPVGGATEQDNHMAKSLLPITKTKQPPPDNARLKNTKKLEGKVSTLLKKTVDMSICYKVTLQIWDISMNTKDVLSFWQKMIQFRFSKYVIHTSSIADIWWVK